MKRFYFAITLLALNCLLASCANNLHNKYLLKIKFTDFESSSVGAVTRISIKVPCGKIVSVQNIPDLYDIEMEYDMPTQNELEARPRLGGAAVNLYQWNNVFTVGSFNPPEECFDVIVQVDGRNGEFKLNLNQLRARQ